MAVSKKRGIKSSAQDNFLEPLNVTSLSGTNVGTSRPYLATANTTSAASAAGTGGAVSLTWTLPAESPAATAYIITTTPSTYTANTGSSTPSYTFQGLASNTSYTFTVKGTNATGTASGTTSSSVTVTTVPQAPTIGTTTTTGDPSPTDTVNWTINATGGSAITGNTVVSSDGPTYAVGAAVITRVVSETAGTSQSYQVFSTNANGNSANSASSNAVTTPSPFGFAPFGFAPFGFAPFGFAPAPPFGFSPFGFAPAPPFSFAPFGPGYSEYSVARNTGVLTVDGRKPASELQVGDKLYAMNISSENVLDWTSWQTSDIVLNSENLVETEIVSINVHQVDKIYSINGDLYSGSHYVLTKKDNIIKFTRADKIDSTYSVYSYAAHDFETIISVETIDYEETVYSINCEPYDNFFTENMLVFDTKDQL